MKAQTRQTTTSRTLMTALAAAGLLGGCVPGELGEVSDDAQTFETTEQALTSVRIRFANLSRSSAKPCISTLFGPFFNVPGGSIAGNTIRGYQGLNASTFTRLRWVSPSANCNTGTARAPDVFIPSVSAGDEFTAVLHEDGSGRDSELFDNQSLPSFASGRFYARYFHGGDGLPSLVGLTVECSETQPDPLPPGSAIFNPAPFGVLAQSENVIPGQTDLTVFSAAVSSSSSSFTTDFRTCNGGTEIAEVSSFTFNGGSLTDIFLTGEGTGGNPYRLITCDDSVSAPSTCTPTP